jgi:hypothetical protein
MDISLSQCFLQTFEVGSANITYQQSVASTHFSSSVFDPSSVNDTM